MNWRFCYIRTEYNNTLSSSQEDHLANASAILECMSDKLYKIPDGLGGGSKAKLVHQIFAGVDIATTSEAMGLATAAGLNTREVFDELKDSRAGSWIFSNQVLHMLSLVCRRILRLRSLPKTS